MESQIRRLAAAAESLEIQARELRAEIRELVDSLSSRADGPAPPAPPGKATEPRPSEPAETKPSQPVGGAAEGARLVALSMALDGKSREETAGHLRESFSIEDVDDLLDDVYSRAGR